MKYHICGDASRILEQLPETGADIINLDYPVNLQRAREVLGGKMTIKGNLRPATLLERSVKDVTEEATRCLSTMDGKPGYILAPGARCHGIQVFENVEVMVKTARSWQSRD